MDQQRPPTDQADHQPAVEPPRARKPYVAPAVVSETQLETRAGSPLPIGPLDPINTPNDYGL